VKVRIQGQRTAEPLDLGDGPAAEVPSALGRQAQPLGGLVPVPAAIPMIYRLIVGD